MVWWVLLWILVVVVVGLVALAIYDLTQRKHAILRNFPVIGHMRFILEAVGPELRQYIVTDNDEERPFSRDHRRWVYSSAKAENTYFGFGTDNDLEQTRNYTIVKQVGNYGEAFERNLGMGSPLKIDRGINRLWTEGGLQYAPPIR